MSESLNKIKSRLGYRTRTPTSAKSIDNLCLSFTLHFLPLQLALSSLRMALTSLAKDSRCVLLGFTIIMLVQMRSLIRLRHRTLRFQILLYLLCLLLCLGIPFRFAKSESQANMSSGNSVSLCTFTCLRHL